MTRRGATTQLLSCQYMHFCTSKASKLRLSLVGLPASQLLSCQYTYFCTSKASKLSTKQIALCHDEVLRFEVAVNDANGVQPRQCQQHVPHDVDGKVDLSSAAG